MLHLGCQSLCVDLLVDVRFVGMQGSQHAGFQTTMLALSMISWNFCVVFRAFACVLKTGSALKSRFGGQAVQLICKLCVWGRICRV